VLPYNVANVKGPVDMRVDLKCQDSPVSAGGGFGWTTFEMMLAAYALGVTAACVLLLRSGM